jgi:hypothetical protein
MERAEPNAEVNANLPVGLGFRSLAGLSQRLQDRSDSMIKSFCRQYQVEVDSERLVTLFKNLDSLLAGLPFLDLPCTPLID